MWLFPHQQAEKSLQNQHVLSILQVGSHQLQYRFFRTNKPKSRHKTNTFCPLTPKSQTTSVKNIDNGVLRLRRAAFWTQRCPAWCVARTRTAEYAR